MFFLFFFCERPVLRLSELMSNHVDVIFVPQLIERRFDVRRSTFCHLVCYETEYGRNVQQRDL